jgi:hypothetical protein
LLICLVNSNIIDTFAHSICNVQYLKLGGYKNVYIENKTELVDVARQLFAKKGLENTTMNDIAVASGKGRRTLIHLFQPQRRCLFCCHRIRT